MVKGGAVWRQSAFLCLVVLSALFGKGNSLVTGVMKKMIIMGVSGAGKSTLGLALAAHLGWTFLDADDFHTD